MVGMMREQALEPTQLYRTVGHLTNLLEANAACEEAQWLGMTTCMQERKQKWDARHVDDKLWGGGITVMLANIMKGVASCQESSKKERDKTTTMDSGGLES
jgi:hypothetical protein